MNIKRIDFVVNVDNMNISEMTNDQEIFLRDFRGFLVLCCDVRGREGFRIDLNVVAGKEDKKADDGVYIGYSERVVVIYATLSLQFIRQ